MPASTVVTPQMARVRDLCDQAKSTPEGITIWFRTTDPRYADLKVAKSLARSIQTTFCNLRVRARRQAQRKRGAEDISLLSTAKGEYDDIACVVQPLPNDGGFKVVFTPAYAVDMDLEVTDNSTGKPFEGEDPTQNRFIVLMGKLFKEQAEATKQHRKPLNPYTTDELAFMWEYMPDECERMGVPSLTSNAISDATDYASVDLASLDESELEIVNPSDGE